MKILLLAQFLPPMIGGEERHVWTLARALAARAHDVTLLGFATSPEQPAESSFGRRTHRPGLHGRLAAALHLQRSRAPECAAATRPAGQPGDPA